MIDIVGKNCCGCSACATRCPNKCIEMATDNEGFIYPSVQQDRCVKCGVCLAVCPVTNNEKLRVISEKEAFGAISKNNDILFNSSSGGVFSHLALSVISSGGCVFGAAFSDDYRTVNHIKIDNAEELYKLQGSKYLQSEQKDCYSLAEKELKTGRVVLYSGTACQIAGLRGYLRKEYDNLFCVDVICHGTPSKKVWEKYLEHIESKYKGRAKKVSFRSKKKSWKSFGMSIPMESGRYYFKTLQEDSYLRIFLKNICLRESCYNCKIKECGVYSDITIGDFWGIEKLYPDIDNSKGVSLILSHTDKGKMLLDRIRDNIDIWPVDYKNALSHNSAFTRSVKRPPERDKFYSYLSENSWNDIEKKYLSEKIQTKVKKNIKKILKIVINRGGIHLLTECLLLWIR